MKEIPGSEFDLDCDLVFLALGFLGAGEQHGCRAARLRPHGARQPAGGGRLPDDRADKPRAEFGGRVHRDAGPAPKDIVQMGTDMPVPARRTYPELTTAASKSSTAR
jgi:hypothetical protein